MMEKEGFIFKGLKRHASSSYCSRFELIFVNYLNPKLISIYFVSTNICGCNSNRSCDRRNKVRQRGLREERYPSCKYKIYTHINTKYVEYVDKLNMSGYWLILG